MGRITIEFYFAIILITFLWWYLFTSYCFDSVTVDSWQFPKSKKITVLTEFLQLLFGNKYNIIYKYIYINIYIYIIYIKFWLGFSIFGLSKLSTVNCNAVTPFFAFHWKIPFSALFFTAPNIAPMILPQLQTQ